MGGPSWSLRLTLVKTWYRVQQTKPLAPRVQDQVLRVWNPYPDTMSQSFFGSQKPWCPGFSRSGRVGRG